MTNPVTNVLAIDPGGTTGLAWKLYGIIDTKAVSLNKALSFLSPHFDIIVVERYATSGRISKYGLQTVDLVGQIKGWCISNNKQYVLQAPQSRKAWQDIANGYFSNKRTVHEKDALAHLLQYLDRHRIPYAN